MANDTPNISDHPERHRYELDVDGRLAARIDYRVKDGHSIDLIHTEVDPAHEGQGLASKIAKFALDDARAKGRKVIASCEYIASYVRKHAQYEDLLAQR
ncbi:MAG TPA: GNAT family N-acetyltransferase [Ramlibacter sp.]|nr:GNAT family N-acetyltransferase [Ramlibacter sp.]